MKYCRLLTPRIFFFLILLALILTSCKSAKTQMVATAIVVNTKASSFTPTSTFLVTSTIIAPSPTLRSDQYPLLSDVALTIGDVPEDSLAYPLLFRNSSYESVSPSIYDMTQELISAGDCYVDCDKKLWENDNLKITLILVRRSNSEEAQQASQGRCFELFPTKVHKPIKYDDCLFAMKKPLVIPNTWAFDRVFGGRYGVINIFAEMGYIGGDDGTIYQLVLTDLAKLQINKFAKVGIPSNQ